MDDTLFFFFFFFKLGDGAIEISTACAIILDGLAFSGDSR
jgi:hypothetical protein